MESHSPHSFPEKQKTEATSRLKEKAEIFRKKTRSAVLKLEPARTALSRVVRSFSPREKLAFLFVCFVFFVSALFLLNELNRFITVEVPSPGGSLTEGVLGTPRFINPVLAISDTDRDLTTIVYSGLLRATPEGALIPDLAESYTVSDDGLTYTFLLKEKLLWHDGARITADDVVFTIAKVKDSALRSPKRASWEGVIAEKVDERTVTFTLLQPYSPFLENTTLGILPEHLWKNISAEQFGFSTLNTSPIGSGPYKIAGIKRDSSGIPVYYDLVPFKRFALGKSYIRDVRLQFYANTDKLFEALRRGEVDMGSAISPERLETPLSGRRVMTYTLPRVFGVFFNQNQNTIFTEKTVREALYLATPRADIVEAILGGYGTPLWGPLPKGSIGFAEHRREDGAEAAAKEEAEALLEKAQWKKDEATHIRTKTVKKQKQELRFSIATSDAEELKRVAEILKTAWEEIGAAVEVKVFKPTDLNQDVIRPRKYDALFFGEIIGRESDPFAFWHSSQRNDPGLNIALYANITTDKLLERGRVELDSASRAAIYREFDAEVTKDIPFVPVYSPAFIYAVPQNLRGIAAGTITIPSERFLDIYLWHVETARVWKIFK